MKQTVLQMILVLIFVILSTVYFYDILGILEVDKTFLTLSTFLFALFTGFFISRQATRYSNIRKLTSDFDGIMSSIYRLYQHYGIDAQKKVGEIVSKHYKKTIEYGWDYHIQNKSTTLTNIHTLTEKIVDEHGTGGIKNAVTNRIISGLHDAQKIRKNMVASHEERIPSFQMILIYLLTVILIIMVSTIPSTGLLLGSLVKAAFITSVIVVVILLKKLDSLELFAGGMGEKSAQDVISIIENKR